MALNSIVLLFARTHWDALMLSGVLIPLTFWVWAWGLLGWHRARVLSFPLLFTGFALPWEYFLRFWIEIPLQEWSADIAVSLLRLGGYPMRYWTSYTIYTNAYYVIVNETCSGMNMLVTLTMYTSVFAWFAQPVIRHRLYLMLLVVPISMLANGIRVGVIYLMGHYGGNELAMGFWHTGSAYIIFMPVFWFLYVINNALLDRSRDARAKAKAAKLAQ